MTNQFSLAPSRQFRYRPLRQIDHSPFQMLQTGLPKRGSQHSDELIELAIAVRDQGFQRPAARARLAGCSNVTISCAWLDNQPILKFPRQRLKIVAPLERNRKFESISLQLRVRL